MLEAVERGIERPLLDEQDLVRELLDAARDRPAMERFEGQRLQNQQVEGALHEVDRLHDDYLHQLV
jgi:hypothetical protein